MTKKKRKPPAQKKTSVIPRQKNKKNLKRGPLFSRRIILKKRKTAKEKARTKRKSFWKRNALVSAFFLFSGFFFYLFILKDLPSPKKLTTYNFPVSTKILDREQNLLYEIYSEKNRTPVKLESLPKYIKQATIVSEDKDFYRHRGFDIKGILRAIYNTIFKHSLQGGSTITQQLVKNALLTQERTIQRKIREAILSWLTEIFYSKDQILEMYLNQVPYGGTAWGIEAAAKAYFGKKSQDLSLAEAALIAGLPASPTRFSPFGAHPELAKDRQERILQQLLEQGDINQQELEEAKGAALNFVTPAVKIKAPHFVLWIKEKLVEEFGQRAVEQGGLRVTTTLDETIQKEAQKIVLEETEKLTNLKVTNGAALVTEPGTGKILAMIGSHDYWDDENDGKVNVVLRPRQPGSSIKPLNYALAFERKILTPASVLNDVPTCFQVRGQPVYCPVNYDGQFHGPVQARFALGNSYNIPAVKTLALNGIKEFVDFANKAGISSFTEAKNYGLSLTLGGGEVMMYDMATAFSIFANRGIRQDLYAIEKIEDWQGKVLYEHHHQEGPRIISLETAYLISHILLDNNARSGAFGSSSYLVVKNHPEVSVKTGTTNDRRDNWTIGYNPDYLVAVWVGNNDNSPMSYVASGVTGASPIWNKIISLVLKDKEQKWPLKPDEVAGATICSLSGLKPAEENPCASRFEYFIQGTVPAEKEFLSREMGIDKRTGQLANDKIPPEEIVLQIHQVIWDKLGTAFCLDCLFPTEAVIVNEGSTMVTPTSQPF